MSEVTELRAVPEFSMADFLYSTKPYDFLYKYVDNKFLLNQMKEKVKLQASMVGVKGFISMWNAYLDSQRQKGALISFDNATDFEGQPLELYSGAYVCTDNGVYIRDSSGIERIVCLHPIMPIQRLVNIDTGEERLKIAFKKGNTWRDVVVEKTIIASSSSILSLAANGIVVTSENAKMLSSYLLEIEQLNYSEIPEQKSVGRLGWVGSDCFSPYVDELMFDGEINFKHVFSSVKEHGSREKWIDAMRCLRAEKSVGRFFLAASFASAILEPCQLLPFFLHGYGGTEVGKTVGLMIAASVWACPVLGDYITTFNSTIVGQEMTAAFLNSLPMIIDELQIQSSAGIKDFDRLIYQLTEGVGRTRGAKAGGLQRVNKWKNCFITSGEHPISNAHSGGGAVNRVLEIECDKKIYSDLVGICDIVTNNYGFAGREFVQYLQQDGIIDCVIELQKYYYHELLNHDSTDKQAASASAILTADTLINELFFKDEYSLTVDNMASIMTKKDDVNVNKRAYSFVTELAVRNMNKFKPNDFGTYTGEIWGKFDGDYIYIIKSVFDREMNFGGYNSVAFLSWAKRTGLLLTSKERRTIVTRIAGVPTNCVCILKNQDFDGGLDAENPFTC